MFVILFFNLFIIFNVFFGFIIMLKKFGFCFLSNCFVELVFFLFVFFFCLIFLFILIFLFWIWLLGDVFEGLEVVVLIVVWLFFWLFFWFFYYCFGCCGILRLWWVLLLLLNIVFGFIFFVLDDVVKSEFVVEVDIWLEG